jgi:hypothetical protein
VYRKKAVVRRSRGNRFAGTLDPHLDVATLQFELGDIFLN